MIAEVSQTGEIFLIVVAIIGMIVMIPLAVCLYFFLLRMTFREMIEEFFK